MPDLPTELWLEVIAHLKQTLPMPDGRAASGQVRQAQLAAMMRVSKRHYSLVAPILYREVVTDDLSLLLLGTDDKRHIDGLPNKRELVLGIEKLHLEYRSADTTNADRASVFWSPDCWRDTKAEIATDEATRTAAALTLLSALIISSASTLEASKLRVVSTGSYLGGRDAHWEMCEIQGGRKAISASRNALLELLQNMDCKGYCQRGVYGPLALPDECPGLLDHGFDVCVHIDQAVFRAPVATSTCSPPCEGFDARPSDIGGGAFSDAEARQADPAKTIWLVESARFHDSTAARELSRESGALPMLLGMYANYYNHNRLSGLLPGEGDVARLTGYISHETSSASTPDTRLRYIDKIREHVNLLLLKTLGYNPRGYTWDRVERDEVTWEGMQEAPACKGCAWVPETQAEGEHESTSQAGMEEASNVLGSASVRV